VREPRFALNLVGVRAHRGDPGLLRRYQRRERLAQIVALCERRGIGADERGNRERLLHLLVQHRRAAHRRLGVLHGAVRFTRVARDQTQLEARREDGRID
jgi:hypothetical protein